MDDTEIIGKEFGFLKVIKKTNQKKHTSFLWECECTACGKKVLVLKTRLLNGDAKSCGCMMYAPKEKNNIDLTNQTFEHIKVLKKKSGNGCESVWECECLLCGKKIEVKYHVLVDKKQKSCGCFGRKKSSENINNYVGHIDKTNLSLISSKKVFKSNTSGVRGVSWDKRSGKWMAYICFQGKNNFLGYYEKLEDAAKVRKKAEEEIYKPILEKKKKEKEEFMKNFRQTTGMSQSKFSEYFGIPVRTLQEWEQGRQSPPPYLLDLLKRIWNAETTSQ